ncbi:MAG TPA: hypothetical protein VGD58_19185 [Herpetosiphonaceae bacterium]
MPPQQDALERRINDLIDLIRDACEFYLLSPAKNARAVFILVDDLCELIMKTALEEAAKIRQNNFRALLFGNNFLVGEAHKAAFRQYVSREIAEAQFRSDVGAVSAARKTELDRYIAQSGDPRDWSQDKGEGFKGFDEVAQEVKELHPTDAILHGLLDAVVGRRTTRNRLFHDQRQTGLTVSEDKCLDALLDLFALAEKLWGTNFRSVVDSNAVVRAQRAVLYFKSKARTRGYLLNEYNTLVSKQRKPILNRAAQGYDYHVLQNDATAFYSRIKTHLEEKIARSRNKIARLQALKDPPGDRDIKVAMQEQEITVCEELLRDCFGVINVP